MGPKQLTKHTTVSNLVDDLKAIADSDDTAWLQQILAYPDPKQYPGFTLDRFKTAIANRRRMVTQAESKAVSRYEPKEDVKRHAFNDAMIAELQK